MADLTEPLALADLIQGGWRSLTFRPFRDGVEICELQGGEPAVALLRYAPGASVPRHRHTGLETILVLDGTQSDERGDYPAGSFILNPAGSEHSVWSEAGCCVLIQWEKPVEFC
ncbi:MAG TPA: allophanate hydrolase [Rhodobacteraceae bacterium]|jgi:anti-sigma factor ChrR (cupin superfamily)|nr:allophanate hydrolase [Paracoccaceae bacterium]